jgi:3-oxoacyl-[acyl-carrier-protein] synthase-3
LFSDGAAATLLSVGSSDALGPFEMGTDGSGFSSLIVNGSGARDTKAVSAPEGKLFMDGASVLMFSMDILPKCALALLKKSGKSMADIDLFVFHQASKLVIDNAVRRLGIPEDKVFVNYSDVGNAVSASIPIALKEAEDKRVLKKNDLVMLVGFGVGYSWAACLLKWE